MLKRFFWTRVIIIVGIFFMFAFFGLYIYARFNIRREMAEYPFDVTAIAYLYSYGLGLSEENNWLGKVKIRIVDFYPSGKMNTEFLYDKNGDECWGTSYYENGQIECTGPMAADKYGTIKDNGIIKAYYENGQLHIEGGTCPGGTCVFDHGIFRKYSEAGKLLSEKYFIQGKECTKAEWKEWLKKHPEDIKYSGRIKD